MEKIRSKDGTPIAYEQFGAGPALIVVPGVLTSARRWPVLPALAKHFTVFAVDRRGHGDSGDAEHYAIEREFEDIAAVVDAIGTEVNVLGHSFGGHCVLGASLLTSHIRRLVVYETDAPEGMYREALPKGLVNRFESLVDRGDRAGAVTSFLREAFQMTPEDIEEAQNWPTFPAMITAAHTFPREIRALQSYQFDVRQFEQMDVPTLLLVGGASPDFARASMERWHAILPNSQLTVMSGQEHLAHYTAPDLFVREVRSFLI